MKAEKDFKLQWLKYIACNTLKDTVEHYAQWLSYKISFLSIIQVWHIASRRFRDSVWRRCGLSLC